MNTSVPGAFAITLKDNKAKYWIAKDRVQGFFPNGEETIIEVMVCDEGENTPTLQVLQATENVLTVSSRYGLA